MELRPDDYEAWGEVTGHSPRGGKRQHKELTESEKQANKQKNQELIEKRQIEAEEQIKDFINEQWGNLEDDEKNRKVQRYFDWVKVSLKQGYPDYDQYDIDRKAMQSRGKGGQNVNKVATAIRLTHIPTRIAVRSETRKQKASEKDAEIKLMELLEEHLTKIWGATSTTFKMEKGVA